MSKWGVKIISGGQTGADRAALDFAIKQGIPHGGWCPKGRRAEDGPIDAKYQLQETPRVIISKPMRSWRTSRPRIVLTRLFWRFAGKSTPRPRNGRVLPKGGKWAGPMSAKLSLPLGNARHGRKVTLVTTLLPPVSTRARFAPEHSRCAAGVHRPGRT
jgi:hypothetical protein